MIHAMRLNDYIHRTEAVVLTVFSIFSFSEGIAAIPPSFSVQTRPKTTAVLRPLKGYVGYKQFKRAVRDLSPNEKYANYEIENSKNDRENGLAVCAGGLFGAGTGIVRRSPGEVAVGGAIAYQGGKQAYYAHQDVVKMETHNEKAENNE